MTAVSLRAEAVDVLQRLIRIDTVNPPGNETAAAELLREYLEESGVECELYARVPERANLVARIRGRGGGPRLALLSHTDTVLADPVEWQVDPWSGELKDDHVWGRGALDMKGQVAASAVAIASLAREGFRPNGDLIFVAAADEEVGAGFGLQWLVEEHPEPVRADYAVNEGAGDRVELGGNVFYLCASAEKMSAPFVLRILGRSGHASIPGIADNALVKAADVIRRIAGFQPEPSYMPETEALVRGVTGGELPPVEEALDRAREISPLAAAVLEPLLSLTMAPTMISASRKRNVIPAFCELTVDRRLQPGRTVEEAEAVLRGLMPEDLDYEYELTEAQGGTRSPLDTPLWDAVDAFVQELEPGARPVPLCVPGFTDSHWLRAAFGTVAYGFFPIRAMDPEVATMLVHSADERVHVDDLELGVEFLRYAAHSIGALE
ncbi:MAG: M20/M25/M40 family metallo-hydrolase [Thermoleophilia bacterium]|nr:M20/M25/M40 family metallo-hydrolase [Thermoleophilia bacterium]